MIKTKPQLISFMNAYSQGKSGGDEIFIQILKRINHYEKTVVTSSLGKGLCQENGLKKCQFLITTSEKKFNHIFITYLKRIFKAIFLKIKLQDKDLIFSSSDILPDVFPAFLLKRKNRKVKWLQKIYHLLPSSRILSYLGQRLSFFFIKYANAIIVDNQIIKKDLVKLGFDKKRIYVNYPGINLEYLHSVKPDKKRKFDCIFIGQTRASKGLLELVDIWKLVCLKKTQAKLGIIGKGNLKTTTSLKFRVKKQKLEKNIEFLGYLPNKIAFWLIKSSKIFVLPSFEEGFSLAALQAQALGLPVIAWDLPVFRQVFPKGMVKIPLRNKDKFSQEIIKLLTDVQYHKKLSKEAIINAQKYDWRQFFKRELKIITSFALF